MKSIKNSNSLLLLLVLAACPADENLSDTSPKDSEASGADDSNSGGVTITGGTETSGKPGTTADETTSSPGETGAVDTTTSGDTTGKPGTSTSEDTTGKPETSTSNDTTDGPGTTGDTSSGGDTTTGAPVGGCPDGWTRARTISITNEPEKPLTNFQVAIKVVWDDDMNADFSDLRFTDAMGAPLSHWVEEYTAPIEALVWVKVPAITAADVTTIEMCYGNPEAKSAGDGVATFHFFDGFDDNTLDPNKWETTAPVEFSLGVLKVLKGAIYTKTNPGSFPNLLIETRTRMVPSVNGEIPYMRISSAQIQADPIMSIGPGAFHFGQYMKTQFFGGQLMCCDSGVFTVYGLGMDEGNTYAIAKRKFSATAKVSWKKPFFIGLGGQMKSAGDMEIHDMWVDWVLIRKFTSVEPTTAVGPEKNL